MSYEWGISSYLFKVVWSTFYRSPAFPPMVPIEVNTLKYANVIPTTANKEKYENIQN